jgi:hypothetical protein
MTSEIRRDEVKTELLEPCLAHRRRKPRRRGCTRCQSPPHGGLFAFKALLRTHDFGPMARRKRHVIV